MKQHLKAASRRYRSEQPASQYIPYRHHVTENIVSTTKGEYVTVFRVRGRTFATASDGDMIRWVDDLNHLIKQIGDEHLSFWSHLHHRRVEEYQHADYSSTFAQMLNERYSQRFDEKPAMGNDFYLSLVYNPVGDATQRYLSKLEKASAREIEELNNEAIAALEERATQVQQAMAGYGLQRLGIYYRDENGTPVSLSDLSDTEDHGPEDTDTEDDLLAESNEPDTAAKRPTGRQYAFSEPMEFFAFLVNGYWEPVPLGRRQICYVLQQTRTVSSIWGDIIQLRNIDGVRYTAAVEVRDYSSPTEPGQLNKFLSAPFEFVLTQTFLCMGHHAAQSHLARQQTAMLETNDKARSQTQELESAVDALVSGAFIYGWHHATVHVFEDTEREVRARASQARNMLGQCGFTASAVGLASEAAFYAKLPANRNLIPRPVPVTSQNYLSFSSFHNLHAGKPHGNPWGDAVAMLSTTAGSPFHFNWHSTPLHENSYGRRPVGHTLFLGQSGSGKTTLMNALLTFSTKFNPRMFAFDRDQGMRQMIMALNGQYTVMEEGNPSGFQPLQLEPTRTNIAFVKRLVRTCAETTLGDRLTPRDALSLNTAVDQVMGPDSIIRDREFRTMTTVKQQIPSPVALDSNSNVTLVELLEPWCMGGQHAWLFDNSFDSLDMSQNPIAGFDISEFIVEKGEPAPETRTPMLMYLLYRIRKTIDGKQPTIVSMDEFHAYLNDPVMDLEIRRGLKTDRKKDAVYVFATQEPNDAIESRIGKTVIQQVATKVLLRNPEANRSDYVDHLKITSAEFDQMVTITEGSRAFIVKQGDMSAVCKFDLSGLDREVSILSGTPDGAELCAEVVSELETNDPAIWMPEYWKRQGI